MAAMVVCLTDRYGRHVPFKTCCVKIHSSPHNFADYFLFWIGGLLIVFDKKIKLINYLHLYVDFNCEQNLFLLF